MRMTLRGQVTWLVLAVALLAPPPESGLEAQPPAESLVVAPDTTGPVFEEHEVDDPVRPKLMQRPEYPPSLREQGICGSVDLAYIVGTNGRAEPRSVAVLRATHADLGAAAADAIRLSIFHPAKRAGTIVRQRVKQRISFVVEGKAPAECH